MIHQPAISSTNATTRTRRSTRTISALLALMLAVGASLLPPAPAMSEGRTAATDAQWLFVTGSFVRVRDEPYLTGTRIGAFPRGTHLEKLLENNGWLLIRHPGTGQTGWMSSDYLRPIPQPQPVMREPPRRATAAVRPAPAYPPKPQPPAARVNPTPVLTAPPPRANFARTQRLFVYGDSLATNLFHGLENYAPHAGFYSVSRRTRGATGLIRDDQFDWYSSSIRHLKTDRPDILVVTFGGNDRQDITSGGRRIRRFSDPWWREYRRRVDRYMAAVKRHVRRVYWLGLPVVRSTRMTADYAEFNRIYRQLAARHGIAYVDTWHRFQVAGHGYASHGLDIDGRSATLRNDDGIHFNRAGSLVLAQLVAHAIVRDTQSNGTR